MTRLVGRRRGKFAWVFWLAEAAYHAAAIVLLLTMLVIATNALLRYFFHGGSSGVYDIARLSFLFIIFLGLTRTNAQGGHARVRLLISLLPPRARSVLIGKIVPILSMVYMAALFVSGAAMTVGYAIAGSRTSGVIAIPLAPVTAIIPLGAALFLAAQIVRFVEYGGVGDDTADHDAAPAVDVIAEIL